jgi:hypothetical protein
MNPLPGAFTSFGSALNSASSQISGFHFDIPSMFGLNPSAPKVATPPARQPFTLGQPQARPIPKFGGVFDKTSAIDADAKPSSFALHHTAYVDAPRGGVRDVHVHVTLPPGSGHDPQKLAKDIGTEIARQVHAHGRTLGRRMVRSAEDESERIS